MVIHLSATVITTDWLVRNINIYIYICFLFSSLFLSNLLCRFRNGIYLQPSSCLSDKEEDEIYGFGYGVFAPRVARGALQATTTANVHHQQSSHPHQHVQQPQTLHHPQPTQHHQQQLQHHGNVPAGQQRCLFRHTFLFCWFLSVVFLFLNNCTLLYGCLLLHYNNYRKEKKTTNILHILTHTQT